MSVPFWADAITACPNGYRSRFLNWNQRASVRVKPQRDLSADDVALLYFPPEQTPAIQHPLIQQRAQTSPDDLLVHRLYQYLRFTTDLEIVSVMPVVMRLSLGESGIALPPAMRADAFRITTDEAWHAQFSFDMVAQVAAQTGIQPALPQAPRFLQRLRRIRDLAGPDLAPLCDLLFAVVSETLISAILSDIPNDQRIRSGVRELIRDHAEDEGRHHSYFRSLLGCLWPALTDRERRLLGPLVPDLVRCFLEPDFDAIALSLLGLGLSQAETEIVVAESYPASQVRQSVCDAARSTVRYFAEVGALDLAEVKDAFAEAGMLSHL